MFSSSLNCCSLRPDHSFAPVTSHQPPDASRSPTKIPSDVTAIVPPWRGNAQLLACATVAGDDSPGFHVIVIVIPLLPSVVILLRGTRNNYKLCFSVKLLLDFCIPHHNTLLLFNHQLQSTQLLHHHFTTNHTHKPQSWVTRILPRCRATLTRYDLNLRMLAKGDYD